MRASHHVETALPDRYPRPVHRRFCASRGFLRFLGLRVLTDGRRWQTRPPRAPAIHDPAHSTCRETRAKLDRITAENREDRTWQARNSAAIGRKRNRSRTRTRKQRRQLHPLPPPRKRGESPPRPRHPFSRASRSSSLSLARIMCSDQPPPARGGRIAVRDPGWVAFLPTNRASRISSA